MASNATSIRNTVAPNLPIGPVEYNQNYQDQFSNALRLYFNQVDNVTGALLGSPGGQYLGNTYISVQNNSNVTATANTATLVTLNTLDYSSGMTLANSAVTVSQNGIYNFQFSIQVQNGNNDIHYADIWLRKNGANLPATASRIVLPARKNANELSYALAAANFFISLNTGDSVALYWATDNSNVSLVSLPALTTPYARPVSPSVVATLSFVSRL
jgi:hypothetical protein